VPAPKAPWDVAGYYPISLEGKEIDIVWLMLAHPVSMNCKAGMELEAAKYGIKLNHFDSNFSTEVISDSVDAAIARGVDLIIISPVDAPSGAPLVERSQAAGIPILLFLNQCDILPDVSVMVDHYANGVASTELLAEALDYKGKVGVVMGDNVHPTGIARVWGFRNTIDKYPDMEVVFDVDAATAPWSRDGAYEAIKGVLTAHPDIDGVFAGDDEMGVGVALALEEAGKTGEIVLVGLGGELSGLTAIKEGRMYGTALYSPYDMGIHLIQAAAYILSSPCYEVGTMQAVRWSDIIPVTIENIDEVPWPLH
jgi:ABC-type sugar transport system substrate-binding protein